MTGPDDTSPVDKAPTEAAPASPAPDQATPTRNPEDDLAFMQVDQGAVARLVSGSHHDPHGILGAHAMADGRTVIRTFRPEAAGVVVTIGDERIETTKIHPDGVFAAIVDSGVPDYRLDVTYRDPGGYTHTHLVDDPYRWLPTLGEVDQHLIGEGRHEKLWEVLGAHVRTYDTPSGRITGTSFAVWAPNAQGVTVVGDFDYWSGRAYSLRNLGSIGVWELFIPDVGAGVHYKFRIRGKDGQVVEKADPMAFATDKPPSWASVVVDSHYEWADGDWLTKRAETPWHASPMSIYEMHLASWREGLSYRDLAEQLVDYLDQTGFTHVEFLPVAEHPFGGSWGYQVTSYYAPTARFGHPDDFKYLVDKLHQAGYGIIVDWVPAHFPKDSWALARFDGTALYENADPQRGEQLDWGTYVFDFGRSEVRNFLVANAVFWLEEFHVDGLRVDAVASMLYLDYSRGEGQWTPNIHGGRENLEAVSFLQEVNATVYKRVPGVVTIAEESTSWPGVTRPSHLGGLGFGFKWNMGWMHDTLGYVSRDPIYREYHHHQMTFSMMYAYTENFVLPISHDEVVHGKGSLLRKMPGDRWQKLANVRSLLTYMWAHPGKQLLFMGSEFAQDSEWADSRSLDWWLLEDPAHAGVQQLVGDINRVYKETSALWSQDSDPAGFSWIDANDLQNNVLSFLRFGSDGSTLACVANFSGVPHHNYHLGLPKDGRWDEVVNSDASEYGGSGVGNLGGIEASEGPWHAQPHSASLSLPPLGTVWLRHSAT